MITETPTEATPSQHRTIARIAKRETVRHVEMALSGRVILITETSGFHGFLTKIVSRTIGKRGKVYGQRES